MNEEVSFPQDVTYISEYEFSNNSVIKTVFIHKNIKIIGKKAFKNCKELRNVIFEQMNEIVLCNSCFQGCFELNTIVSPEGLKEIPKKCFMNCFRLKNVVLPTSLIKIDQYSFYNCLMLENIRVTKHEKNKLNGVLVLDDTINQLIQQKKDDFCFIN